MKNSGFCRLLFACPLTAESNLDFALRCLRGIKGQLVTFDIYGSIEDQKYWQICQEEIAQLPACVSVRYQGEAHPNIEGYDFFVLPGQPRSKIADECLRAGVPVLNYGLDETAWRKVLQKCINASAEEYAELS